MRFWSILGKIKPGNEKNRCMLCLKRLSWGSGVILELKIGENDEMLPHVHPSPSTSRRSVGAVRSVKMGQDYREKLFGTYFA